MKIQDVIRYGLWGAIVLTADANRREYHLTTAWLPHLLTNTLSLLLPDVARLLLPKKRQPASAIEELAAATVRDNENYVIYVMPLAAGYLLSHPRFNIYKGDWARIRLAGFGLDAIPHSATALGLTMLVSDTLRTAAHIDKSSGWFSKLLDWGSRNREIASLGVLTAATLMWEFSEYRVNKYELAQRGDASKINMQWDEEDTLRDVISNLVGWIVGTLWSHQRSRHKTTTPQTQLPLSVPPRS